MIEKKEAKGIRTAKEVFQSSESDKTIKNMSARPASFPLASKCFLLSSCLSVSLICHLFLGLRAFTFALPLAWRASTPAPMAL